ncbi:hypothetical protein [Flavobacterium humidisoli]|uniref:DUF3592 domain-containing protein n=1 Tax=Flavobacterium humidisoli TaxID=2937442 RepID=A0ABY4LYY2_9FLAO|nr:hypothetical protein [Flavobacterium humidisoli]UPZ16826.1 hypothetical protein M0M44_05640 [Flavobacterium humidisoli]
MKKREVPFSILIKLIKSKGPISLMGFIFTFSSLFILFPFVFFISELTLDPYQKYNLDEIKKYGLEQKARIINIKSIKNVSINGEHPLLFNYQYTTNGKIVSDKFQTMDFDKTQNIKIGDEIKIKMFENQSKISGLEPFTFPFYIFYLLPFIFFIVGATFLLITLKPSLREYNLYKNGIVKDANIISIILNSGIPLFNIAQKVSINYYYIGSDGKKIFGKSNTSDYSIINEKKENDKIKIFVSETNESNSCLIPKLEALQNQWKM